MSAASRRGLDPMQTLFVGGWDGDVTSTSKRTGIDRQLCAKWANTDWFMEAICARQERELKRIDAMRVAKLRDAIADRLELQALWSSIARGERQPILNPDTGLPEQDDKGQPKFADPPPTRDRLAAAKLLADSLGMSNGTQTIVHEGGEKPIQVAQVDIEERIKLMTTGRRTALTPAEDWLS